MQNELPENGEAQMVWQNQPAGPLAFSMEVLREKARKLRARTRRQLLGSTAVVVGVTAVAIAGGVRTREPGLHIAFVLGVVWALIGLYLSNRGSWSAVLPGDAARSTCQEFYRRELLRRTYMLHRFLLWFFGPVVFCFGTVLFEGITFARHLRRPLSAVAPTCALFVIWVVAILVMQFRDKRDLRRAVKELAQIERHYGTESGDFH